jgi:hypothetical protein
MEEKLSSDSDIESKEAYLSILVVNIDYVLFKQTVNDDFSVKNDKETVKIPSKLQVFEPVIRIFGSTPFGQRTCAHVHGVFIMFALERGFIFI